VLLSSQLIQPIGCPCEWQMLALRQRECVAAHWQVHTTICSKGRETPRRQSASGRPVQNDNSSPPCSCWSAGRAKHNNSLYEKHQRINLLPLLTHTRLARPSTVALFGCPLSSELSLWPMLQQKSPSLGPPNRVRFGSGRAQSVGKPVVHCYVDRSA